LVSLVVPEPLVISLIVIGRIVQIHSRDKDIDDSYDMGYRIPVFMIRPSELADLIVPVISSSS